MKAAKTVEEISGEIYDLLLSSSRNSVCKTSGCQQCADLYLKPIRGFVERGLPVEFILPAFPAKSPNRQKTLGPLPDKGEEMALEYLLNIENRIKSVYEPGAHIMIASDGRVFGDVVNVSEEDVKLYNRKLKQWIDSKELDEMFSFYDLNDAFTSLSVDMKRELLIELYGVPLSDVKKEIRDSKDARDLFNGLHRFLFEDMERLFISRSKARKATKERAYRLYQLSNAWSNYLKDTFPEKVRLSIHPHHPHSGKLGIMLNAENKGWGTPWHRVALKTSNGFSLVKRNIAEKLGAKLIYKNNHPYYYAVI